MKKLFYIIGGVIILIFIIAIAGGEEKKKTEIETENINYEINIEDNDEIAEGWTRINIGNIGSIDYPDDLLELQSGIYKEVLDEIRKIFKIEETNFILQQKGLNDLLESSFDGYARIMFQTIKGDTGGLTNINKRPPFSESELNELGNELRNQTISEFEKLEVVTGQKNKIIEWNSAIIKEIDNMYPIILTYKRQLNDNPIVSVKQYQFWDDNQVYRIVFSYRVEDESKYKDIYEDIIKSFSVNN